jgi:PAS domain S-box-containing protein
MTTAVPPIATSTLRPIQRVLSPTDWPWWAAIVVGLAYASLEQLCLLLDVPGRQAAVMWLPSGLLVGVLAMTDRSTWWRWLVVQLPFHLVPNLIAGRSAGVSLGYTLANLLEAIVAAWLLQRLRGSSVTIARLKDVLNRLLPAGIVGAAVSAPLAGLITAQTAGVESALSTAGIWFGAVLLGILVVAPLVIAWIERGRKPLPITRRTVTEGSAVILLLVVGSFVLFSATGTVQSIPLLYMPYPLLIWSALRLPQTISALATALLTGISAWYTVRGQGPLVALSPDMDVRVLWLQGYVLVTVLTTLFVSSVVEARRRATRALAEREAQYELVTSHAQDVIMMSDFEGRFIFVSPASQQVTGYPPDELLRRSAYEFIHPDDRETVARAAMVIKTTGVPSVYRHRGRHADGSWRWVEVNAALANPEAPLAERMLVSVTRDIARQHALEHELSRARSLESVGRLASGLAHDFNNILTAILGGLESARSDPRGSAAVREELRLVEQAADRGRQITKQLLNVARRAPDAPQMGDIDALVRSSLPVIRTLVGVNVKVFDLLAAGSHQVRMDAGQIHQVLLNLAANARDAMTGRGTLTLRSSVQQWSADALDRPLLLSPGQYLTLQFDDTGPGVPDPMREQIFEPFFTTKSASEGTGLGLASAFGIARQHGGLLWCTDAPEGGARFTLALPMAHAATDAGAGSRRREPAAVG